MRPLRSPSPLSVDAAAGRLIWRRGAMAVSELQVIVGLFMRRGVARRDDEAVGWLAGSAVDEKRMGAAVTAEGVARPWTVGLDVAPTAPPIRRLQMGEGEKREGKKKR